MLARRAVTSSVHVQVRGHVARSESAEKGNGVPPPSSRTSVRPCSHAHRGASLPMQRTWPAWRKDCRLLRLRSTQPSCAGGLADRGRLPSGSYRAPSPGPACTQKDGSNWKGCTHARMHGRREHGMGSWEPVLEVLSRARGEDERCSLCSARGCCLLPVRNCVRGRLAKRHIAQLTILVRPGAQRPSQGFATDNAACKCRARPQANARVGWPLAGLTYVASVLSGCTEKSSGLIAGA